MKNEENAGMKGLPETFVKKMRGLLGEEAKEFFESLNMGCLSCMGIQNETLEKSCLMHGLNLEEIMEKLNNLSNQ